VFPSFADSTRIAKLRLSTPRASAEIERKPAPDGGSGAALRFLGVVLVEPVESLVPVFGVSFEIDLIGRRQTPDREDRARHADDDQPDDRASDPPMTGVPDATAARS
jgi:hypothetical protein